MVNSVKRLQDMKDFMRGRVEAWNCRAGQNNVIIRVDGTLAPCFAMYSATYDWGTIGNHTILLRMVEPPAEILEDHNGLFDFGSLDLSFRADDFCDTGVFGFCRCCSYS
jgi:hypothetical protein